MTSSSESEAEIITAEPEITSILQRVVTSRLFVSVFLPRSRKEYTSTILSVDTPAKRFRLDELFPTDGDERLRQDPHLTIGARIQGAEMSLSSRVVDFGTDEMGLAYYEVAYPAEVRYLQRREHHRVRVDRLDDVPVDLFNSDEPDAAPVRGVLHDLSGGGFSAWLKAEDAEALGSGEAVDRCEIHMEGEEPIACGVVVRSVRFVGERNRYILGGQFISNDPRVLQRINRVVVALERRMLQRKASSYV